jgi:hypothetical protein
MSPGDVFVGVRHFFGYVIPGAMWTSGLMLIERWRPDALVNPFQIAAFVVVSYILGIAIHGHLYRLIAGWDERRAQRRANEDSELHALRAAAGSMVKAIAEGRPEPTKKYLESLDAFKLEEYCRRYVIAGSEHLAKEFDDYEGSINFFIGAPPAFIVFVSGVAVYTTRKGVLERWHGWFLIFAAAIIGAWLIFARLPNKHYEQRKVWLKAFLALTMQENR